MNLDISQGEFVSVMGPSGSGKSTLLYSISGMDRMTSGSVKFCERVLFMSDGVITGEKRLGKYSKDKTNVKNFENELSSWLVQMGF